MTTITVRRLAGPFEHQMLVTVGTDQGRTEHEVSFTEADRRLLAGGRLDAESLTRASFEFLLARESNRSILKKFRLPQITDYYPEYPTVMGEEKK